MVMADMVAKAGSFNRASASSTCSAMTAPGLDCEARSLLDRQTQRRAMRPAAPHHLDPAQRFDVKQVLRRKGAGHTGNDRS